MQPLFVILILLALSYMAWQDFADRAIDWFLFPVVAALLVVNSILLRAFAWNHLLVNIGLLSVQLALVALYFKLSRGQLLFAGQQLLGWGDILFFLVLTLAFSPLNFILFYIASLLLTLLFFLILALGGRKVHSIPLAGSQAVILIAVFLIDIKQWGLYLYNDNLLFNFLNHAYVHLP